MFTYTENQLSKILPQNTKVNEWYDAFNRIFPNYEINSLLRISAFLAQAAHESAELTVLRENLNYKAESLIKTWPTRFTPANAHQYAKKPELIANKVYANRMGNGPETSGDGWKFKGRGILQLTGKAAYRKCSLFLFDDIRLLNNPMLLENDMDVAVESACWVWFEKQLNELADEQKFREITYKINGGYTGEEDRLERYNNILSILRNGE